MGARGAGEGRALLHAVERVAARLGIRWYLFGAQAVLLYGVIRTTADVDVTAEIPASRVPAFVRAIDLARVRQVLEAVEAALGQSDLIPAFERLARSAKKAGPRRGSGMKRTLSTSRK